MRIVDYLYLVGSAWFTWSLYRAHKVCRELLETVKEQRETIRGYPAAMTAAKKLYEDMKERAQVAEWGLRIAQETLRRHGFELTLGRLEETTKPTEKEN